MKNSEIISLLLDRKITLGSIESFTGGLFAAEVVRNRGVSEIFKGAIVAYQNEIKERIIKVPHEMLEKFGAVSGIVAQELARNGKKILGVDFCLAFTGNADSNSGELTAGDVYIALAYGKDEIVEHLHLKGDRNEVRVAAVSHAFKILERVLENYI